MERRPGGVWALHQKGIALWFACRTSIYVLVFACRIFTPVLSCIACLWKVVERPRMGEGTWVAGVGYLCVTVGP